MSRPLTVADRAPEVGDVVEHIEWPGYAVPIVRAGPSAEKGFAYWRGEKTDPKRIRYVSRADNGPITIDD